jgi:hypothetical protein
MGLNKKGILQLAEDLISHRKRYDQNNWVSYRDKESGYPKSECGTVCCMAGFCYMRKVGVRKFNSLVKKEETRNYEIVSSGISQLGIKYSGPDWTDRLGGPDWPIIFGGDDAWPSDLSDGYDSSEDQDRYIVALKALQRLLPDGSIDPDPKAVHTRIPQLKEILAKRK